MFVCSPLILPLAHILYLPEGKPVISLKLFPDTFELTYLTELLPVFNSTFTYQFPLKENSKILFSDLKLIIFSPVSLNSISATTFLFLHEAAYFPGLALISKKPFRAVVE